MESWAVKLIQRRSSPSSSVVLASEYARKHPSFQKAPRRCGSPSQMPILSMAVARHSRQSPRAGDSPKQIPRANAVPLPPLEDRREAKPVGG